GLWSTAADLVKFLAAVCSAASGASRGVLDQASATALIAPERGIKRGLAFFATSLGPATFGHDGDTQGFCCRIAADPASGSGVAVMTNSDAGHPLIDALI